MALPELRARLNMVVQDASLCSGTLRDALDITGEKDDHEVYEALRRVHLLPETLTKEEMRGNPFANLESFVAIGEYICSRRSEYADLPKRGQTSVKVSDNYCVSLERFSSSRTSWSWTKVNTR